MFLSNPFRFFPDTLYNSFGEKSIFAPYFCVTKFNTQTNKRSWYYKILGTLFSTKANSIFFNFQKLFLYSKKILFVITSFEKKLIEKENQRPTKLMIRGVPSRNYFRTNYQVYAKKARKILNLLSNQWPVYWFPAFSHIFFIVFLIVEWFPNATLFFQLANQHHQKCLF